MLDVNPVLSDQNVFGKGRDRTIARGFDPSIVALGRGRQNLDDHRRVEERIEFPIDELRLTTDDDHIGIREEVARGPHSHGLRIDLARTPLELTPNLPEDVACYQIVDAARPGHREDLAVEVVVLRLRLTLERQIILNGEPLAGIGGHGITLTRSQAGETGGCRRHRRCIHTHCSGRRRTCSSIFAVIRAVASVGSAGRSRAGWKVARWRPPDRRSMKAGMTAVCWRRAILAAPTGVKAGRPKKGTQTPSTLVSWSISMPSAPPRRNAIRSWRAAPSLPRAMVGVPKRSRRPASIRCWSGSSSGRATTAMPRPRQLMAAASSSQLPQWPVRMRIGRSAARAFSISCHPRTSTTDSTKPQSRWNRWRHSPRVVP